MIVRKRFPHYRQNNSFDCGPTCLRMVAKHHGADYSAETLRRHCHVSKRGVSMLGISEAAAYIGFETAGVRLSLCQLAEYGSFPCILHWNQNHFVVCYGIERLKDGSVRVRISDPASQRLSYAKDEFLRCWTGKADEEDALGTALLLEPGDGFGSAPDECRNDRRGSRSASTACVRG